MSHNERLRTESVGKLLLQFSIPAIVGMMVQALYNIVDRIYIGMLGPMPMTGIGLSMPLMILLMGFSMLVGIGSASRISIRLGEDNEAEAEHILGNAFVMLILIMGAVSILGLIFKTPLLYLFGASDATFGYANDYLTIILIGGIFQGLGFGLNNAIRAEGNPRMAMYTMLIGAISNIILDPIFIFVFDMGIQGAALATIISQLLNTIWVIRYFKSGRSRLSLKIENMKLDPRIMISIVTIGMSPFFMQVAASVVTTISNNALATYGGDIAISAMTVINSLAMFFLMPIFGINQGSQPIIGFNYGAKEYKRVKKALTLAILAATSIAVLGFILTQFFTVQMIKLFNSDPELIDVATVGMRTFLKMLPIIGFQIVSSNYFQAVGKAQKSMFMALLRQVLLLIPLFLILPKFFGLMGVWYAGPTADFIASLVTGTFLFIELRHLDSSHNLKASQSV
ncbi:MATE family efflux transporter [Fusibacter tunisiensis]|uniref:Multidrug export protein MepA n=1 Tax=Fusibacter tunisiensis TaxID=1008308 RepID=A0ABS2MSW8_9FIRM|nr:MATE family efflux transporter [Fusibacter tunisiensis]MBM7562467.1 putative MATE family efflux protein [Fusibacter tunisiensis]